MTHLQAAAHPFGATLPSGGSCRGRKMKQGLEKERGLLSSGTAGRWGFHALSQLTSLCKGRFRLGIVFRFSKVL